MRDEVIDGRYGETGSRPYMALEYLPGGTLEDRLHAGRPLGTPAYISPEQAAGRPATPASDV